MLLSYNHIKQAVNLWDFEAKAWLKNITEKGEIGMQKFVLCNILKVSGSNSHNIPVKFKSRTKMVR